MKRENCSKKVDWTSEKYVCHLPVLHLVSQFGVSRISRTRDISMACYLFLSDVRESHGCVSEVSSFFQLISLYPHMMPAGTSFMRAHPPLHEIGDVRMLAKGKEENLREYKHFLVAFLQDISGTKLAHGFQKVGSVCTLPSPLFLST